MTPSIRLGLLALLFSSTAMAVAAGCGSNGGSSGGSTSGAGAGSSGSAGSTGSGGAGGPTASTGPGGAGGAGGAAAGTGGAATGSTGSGGHPVTACQGHVYACGDGMDNDGDGLIDSDDPDCLGPCDNTEGSYFGGIPGQNNAPCKQDCYFDQDTGPGNDDCYWDHKCDPHEVAPAYNPESEAGAQCAYDPGSNVPGSGKSCADLFLAQSQQCTDYCGPLTPNGCDCFGCCELPAGSKKYVWLGSVDADKQGSCDIAGVNDPAKCQPCQPVQACLNACGPCELCIGKSSLPPECFPDGGSGSGSSSSGGGAGGGSGSGSSSSGGLDGQCSPGTQACGLPGQPSCPVNYYCVTGCCQKIPG